MEKLFKRKYPLYYILVPDGISFKNNNIIPSSTFKASLNYIIKNNLSPVIICPANKFGSNFSEQFIANKYLISNGYNGEIYFFEFDVSYYIDTTMNASILKKNLIKNNFWNINSKCVIISNRYHLNRSLLIFKHFGFNIVDSIGTLRGKKTKGEKIPLRLSHYRIKLIHSVYEFISVLIVRSKIWLKLI